MQIAMSRLLFEACSAGTGARGLHRLQRIETCVLRYVDTTEACSRNMNQQDLPSSGMATRESEKPA